MFRHHHHPEVVVVEGGRRNDVVVVEEGRRHHHGETVIVEQPRFGGSTVVVEEPHRFGHHHETVIVEQPRPFGSPTVVVEEGRRHHHGETVIVEQPRPFGGPTVVVEEPHRFGHHGETVIVEQPRPFGVPSVAAVGVGYGGVGVAVASPVYAPPLSEVVYIQSAPHIRPVDPFSLVNTGRHFILQSFLGSCAGVLSFYDGAPVVLAHADHHNSHIKWTITAVGDGSYALHTVNHHHLVLAQHGGLFDNGGQITLADSHLHGHFHHTHVSLEPHMEGWVLRFRHSGKALTASAVEVGSPLFQWDIYVADTNRWRFLAL